MPVVIGSMYRTPYTPADNFTKHISEIVSKIRQEKRTKEIRLGMDHNLDLLHSDVHQPTHRFLDNLLDKQLYPVIHCLGESWVTKVMST